MNLIPYFFLFLSMSIFLLTLNIIMSKKSYAMREKKSPFECGFDPMSNLRMPFSIQFFLISLMFLIFDIEIAILIPMIYFTNSKNFFIFTTLFFMVIIILSIYIEYSENMIEWKN